VPQAEIRAALEHDMYAVLPAPPPKPKRSDEAS
jgi:hypothetical protein